MVISSIFDSDWIDGWCAILPQIIEVTSSSYGVVFILPDGVQLTVKHGEYDDITETLRHLTYKDILVGGEIGHRIK